MNVQAYMFWTDGVVM